ncbi:hypothetical protein [Micromonospora haikouensis]|uniref:hypothetical protein n=1 Tax=Micromonospora haikouensis TaxID=686309 RepID=UPI003D712D17
MAENAASTEDLSLRARTRLAHIEAIRDAAEYLIQQAPTGTDQHAAPGEHITAARRARIHALHVLDSAVLLDLASGASWELIAERLGLPVDGARARYEQMWLAWQSSQTPASATPAELDSWYTRVCPEAPPNAVSAGLF